MLCRHYSENFILICLILNLISITIMYSHPRDEETGTPRRLGNLSISQLPNGPVEINARQIQPPQFAQDRGKIVTVAVIVFSRGTMKYIFPLLISTFVHFSNLILPKVLFIICILISSYKGQKIYQKFVCYPSRKRNTIPYWKERIFVIQEVIQKGVLSLYRN